MNVEDGTLGEFAVRNKKHRCAQAVPSAHEINYGNRRRKVGIAASRPAPWVGTKSAGGNKSVVLALLCTKCTKLYFKKLNLLGAFIN